MDIAFDCSLCGDHVLTDAQSGQVYACTHCGGKTRVPDGPPTSPLPLPDLLHRTPQPPQGHSFVGLRCPRCGHNEIKLRKHRTSVGWAVLGSGVVLLCFAVIASGMAALVDNDDAIALSCGGMVIPAFLIVLGACMTERRVYCQGCRFSWQYN